MTTTTAPESESHRTGRIIDLLIRLSVLALLIIACWSILLPFLGPVVWGAVLAIAVAPVHARLARSMGGRSRLAAAAITVGGLAVIIVPTALLTLSAVRSGLELGADFRDGTLTIPPPPADLAETPLVGEPLHEAWELAHSNLEQALAEWGPEIKNAAAAAVGFAGSLIVQAGFFALAILLAGVFLAFSDSSETFARRLGERIAPGKGAGIVELSTATMRSVAKGVLGVAVIQALAAGIGMLIAGVPGAGLWALGVLIVAIIQLPPILVLLPAIAWYFSLAGTGPGIALGVYLLLVSGADTFLKPMLLGRGLEVPMPVILLGAIGGMLSMGIIGLFTGAVTLALGFTLFQSWLAGVDEQAPGGEPESAPEG